MKKLKMVWKRSGALAAAMCGVALLAASGTAALGNGMRAQDDAANEKAQALIKKAREAYQKLESYQDRLIMRIDFESDDPNADAMIPPEEREQEGKVAYADPNRIALEQQGAQIYSNGKTMWIALEGLDQYLEREAPANLAEFDDDELMMAQGFIEGHPALAMILGEGDEIELMFGKLGDVSKVVAEEREGVAGHRIVGAIDMGDEMTGMGIELPAMPMTVWVSDETSLFGEMTVDATGLYKAMAEQGGAFGMPNFSKFEMTMTFEDVKVNEPIADEVFVFSPPEGMEKVASFDFGGGFEEGPSQDELIGEPAPEWSTADLDGDTISLADFKGKVVVMDFWATWCPPCVQAMPEMQELKEKFADKPVVVLGINQDAPGSDDEVREFLKKKNFTMRQAMDDGTIGGLYGVSAIPCVVIVDQEGVIHDISVGYTPGKGEQLAKKIEALLKDTD